METQTTEQKFIKKAVKLVKDKGISTYAINELLKELKVGEIKE